MVDFLIDDIIVETIVLRWYPAAFAAAFTFFKVEAFTLGESLSASDTVPFDNPSLCASSLMETYTEGFVSKVAICLKNDKNYR